MSSCYNMASSHGQRFPAQQQIYQPPTLAPYFGSNVGPPGFGQAVGAQGFSGASGASGMNLQYPRQFPAPANMSNNVATSDYIANRFPRMFNAPYSSFGPTPTASTTSSSCGATPSPPPMMHNTMAYGFDSTVSRNMFYGIGTIVWLTPERGLIENVSDGENDDDGAGDVSGSKSPGGSNDDNNNCENGPADSSKPQSPNNGFGNRQISFGIKEFCDQAVGDLTSVLRVGFLVKYHAILDPSSAAHSNFGSKSVLRLVANFVSPVPLADWTNASPSVMAASRKLCTQLDTPAAEPLPCDDASKRKDMYDLELELRATKLLMNIYREQASEGPQCQLSTFHCIVSNCRDDQMYRYIGTSSQKRRQFIEKRTHFFAIAQDDLVCLVPAAVHTAISSLAKEILQRGGAIKSQELFNQYSNWPSLPLEAREIVGETKRSFMHFLEAHPFVFNIFPSRVFVSLRHQLPGFDYGSFLEELFGDQEGSPLYTQCHTTSVNAHRPMPGQVGHTQQQPGPNYWGRCDEQRGPYGNTGNQGCLNSRRLVTPPGFPQPTPPVYPQLAGSRFNPQSNFNFNVPPPPLAAPHRSVLSTPQWPPHPHQPRSSPIADELKMSAGLPNIGGSNQSVSSGYSTGPVPSTPGPNHAQQFWPSGAGIGDGGGVRGPPENVAGFWKSYELGTESLIRQLHLSNNGLPGGTTAQEGFVGLPDGSRLATPDITCLGRSLSASSSFKGISNSDNVTQTDRLSLAVKCGNCGVHNEWTFAPLDTGTSTNATVIAAKPEMVDASVQTGIAGNW